MLTRAMNLQVATVFTFAFVDKDIFCEIQISRPPGRESRDQAAQRAFCIRCLLSMRKLLWSLEFCLLNERLNTYQFY